MIGKSNAVVPDVFNQAHCLDNTKKAEEELNFLTLNAKRQVHFNFEDPFKNRFQSEGEQEQQIATLYETMYRQLYEFYRDELSEQLLPRCTCGANTYCRCE